RSTFGPTRSTFGPTRSTFKTDPQHFWTDPQHFWTDPQPPMWGMLRRLRAARGTATAAPSI
ncbi:MAG: hypothetical protein WCI05_13050, partial [Myxococcales bacterium]